MANDQPPSIDPVAAARWAAMAHTSSPWLHEEVARRMAQRLSWIRVPVQRWLHWEPLRSGRQAQALVAAQYPQAECVEVTAAAAAEPSQEMRSSKSWWRRLTAGPASSAPARMAVPPAGGAQLVWANMLAHQTHDPHALMGQWREALADGGFLMFSCFGPDTLRELRTLYAELAWPPSVQDFTDMHDWGDQLLAARFADPVMDMEHITLTFDSPERLLAELRGLGRNLHRGRFGALRTPAWRQHLLAAMDERLRPGPGQPLTLTFEIIYGHALRPAPGPAREPITIHRTRASLTRGIKTPPAH